jgi:hypothetical protein
VVEPEVHGLTAKAAHQTQKTIYIASLYWTQENSRTVPDGEGFFVFAELPGIIFSQHIQPPQRQYIELKVGMWDSIHPL